MIMVKDFKDFYKFCEDEKNRWSINAPGAGWGDRLDSRFVASYLLRDVKGKRLLDLGCNNGLTLSGIDKSNKRYGFDYSLPFVKAAKRLNGDAHLLVSDMLCIPFHDASFDFVAAFGMLEVPQPWDKPAFFRELSRIMSAGGRLLLTTLNRKHLRPGDKSIFIDYDSLVRLLKKDFSFEIYGFNPFPDFPFFLPNRILSRVPGIWRLLIFLSGKKMLLRSSRSFIVIATKKGS